MFDVFSVRHSLANKLSMSVHRAICRFFHRSEITFSLQGNVLPGPRSYHMIVRGKKINLKTMLDVHLSDVNGWESKGLDLFPNLPKFSMNLTPKIPILDETVTK